jgi:TonB family protein
VAGAWLAALAVSVPAAGQDREQTSAPRFIDGGAPAQNPMAVGGGEVVLELSIDARGNVAGVRPLRDTPPFGQALISAVRTWRFEPAVTTGGKTPGPVAAGALVVGVFRAPTLYGGPTLGTPPAPVAAPSPHLPSALSMPAPAHPPNSIDVGVVLIEIELSAAGQPVEYRVLSPASGFDSAALAAVRTWRFSPPSEPGSAAGFAVYAVLGFRPPVVP